MVKNYLDAGTTWSKILTIDENSTRGYRIVPTSDLAALNLVFDAATGHSTKITNAPYENEVVALAKGANELLMKGALVLDLGSRDIKWVKFKDGKFSDMDWNSSCASATGATIEMLLKFYNVDIKNLTVAQDRYAITCGIFGLEKIMDDVASGLPAEDAISKFIGGIAYNAWNFTKNPDEICISGGFCENKCFINSLSKYCKVTPIGRFVLVDGLHSICQKEFKKSSV